MGVILRHEPELTLVVKDDGIGCPVNRAEGVGSRLIRLLAQQLGAVIEWEPGEAGCQARLTFRHS